MNELKLPLVRCLQELNFSFNDFLTNQSDRIVFQKYGLFLEEIFGVGTGDYSLYIYGPYNPSLARVGYEIAADFREYDREARIAIRLSENAIRILREIREIFSNNNVADRDLLEIYATYFYLVRRKGYIEGSEQVIEKLELIKGKMPRYQEIIPRIVPIHQQISRYLSTPAN
ncbi:MAG: hypothetical protein LBL00_08655 [Endomicrobium sp.]|jgi:hypothetical protein|nr:hypothetical protein [Endomicrobium sp.]